MSDTEKSFYTNKIIDRILGKPENLSQEEIAEIDEEAEKATERFRKRMEKSNRHFIKKSI